MEKKEATARKDDDDDDEDDDDEEEEDGSFNGGSDDDDDVGFQAMCMFVTLDFRYARGGRALGVDVCVGCGCGASLQDSTSSIGAAFFDCVHFWHRMTMMMTMTRRRRKTTTTRRRRRKKRKMRPTGTILMVALVQHWIACGTMNPKRCLLSALQAVPGRRPRPRPHPRPCPRPHPQLRWTRSPSPRRLLRRSAGSRRWRRTS